MKINQKSLTLSFEEFSALCHIASSVLPNLEKPYDDMDSYFNNENVFCVSAKDYNVAKRLLELLFSSAS